MCMAYGRKYVTVKNRIVNLRLLGNDFIRYTWLCLMIHLIILVMENNNNYSIKWSCFNAPQQMYTKQIYISIRSYGGWFDSIHFPHAFEEDFRLDFLDFYYIRYVIFPAHNQKATNLYLAVCDVCSPLRMRYQFCVSMKHRDSQVCRFFLVFCLASDSIRAEQWMLQNGKLM